VNEIEEAWDVARDTVEDAECVDVEGVLDAMRALCLAVLDESDAVVLAVGECQERCVHGTARQPGCPVTEVVAFRKRVEELGNEGEVLNE